MANAKSMRLGVSAEGLGPKAAGGAVPAMNVNPYSPGYPST
jgi:hypothetical protein